jgi:hypothetical protein
MNRMPFSAGLLALLSLLCSCGPHRNINPKEISQNSTYLQSLSALDGVNISHDNRKDPVLDPFSSYQPSDFSTETRAKHQADIDILQQYVGDSYFIEPWEDIRVNGNFIQFYLEPYGEIGKWKIAFFDEMVMPYKVRSMAVSPYANGIYSNGKWSYALTVYYDGKKQSSSIDGMKRQLYGIYHDSSFPYDAYYSNDCLFLMNRDPAFSEEYFAKFRAAKGTIYRLNGD